MFTIQTTFLSYITLTKFWKDCCLYNFLEKKEIFSLQFGFRQKYSNTHSFTHLTDKFRREIDKCNYACGVFANFQKRFDTADHHILLKKLEYYGVSTWLQIQIHGLLRTLVTGSSLFQLMVTYQIKSS